MRWFSIAGLLIAVLDPAQSQPQAATAAEQFTEAQQDIQKGHASEAIAILEKLNQITPPMKGVAHDLGLARYRSSKLMEAQQAFMKAVQDDPALLGSSPRHPALMSVEIPSATSPDTQETFGKGTSSGSFAVKYRCGDIVRYVLRSDHVRFVISGRKSVVIRKSERMC